MTYKKELLGAFIVPTGIGASIGGYAGDASCYARMFTRIGNLIVNPNVVNAGGFSGINSKMFYVEGLAIDEFFKGNFQLSESFNNKIGVIFDKSISEEVLNIHINTINAVKTVYGCNIKKYIVTDMPVGVDFYVDNSGISTGYVKNQETILRAAKKLVNIGCDAIAIVCLFKDEDSVNYENGIGVDPVGGVEAIISHYITRELHVPCAHSPAFLDFSITTNIVNSKAASEYITPTFLPCILLGLSNAPKINNNGNITLRNLDYLVVPSNAVGSIPVFEAIKNNIPIYAIEENVTVLNVTNESINATCGINILGTYKECLEHIQNEYKI